MARFRLPTKRERISANNAANSFYAGASERLDAKENLDKILIELPPKRERVKRCDGRPIEQDVIRAVSDLLAAHPKCLFSVRQNTGGASYEHSTGKHKPIFFYHILTRGEVTITDFWGLLKTGAPYAFEAKRPGWRGPSGYEERQRVERQAAFIAIVKEAGGIGAFVTDALQVKSLLDDAP